MSEQPWRDPETLRELYVRKGMTQKEIGNKFGCADRTVGKYLNRYNIDRKPPEWGQKDVLKEKYVYNNKTVHEIADEYGVSGSSVYYWVEKHGLKKPWNSDDLLQKLYCDDDMTQEEIAEKLNCEQGTVSYRLREMGVETNPDVDKPPYYGCNQRGYMVVQSTVNGVTKGFLLHRLLAVAEYGFDEIKEMHVHHKNHIQWDNRPDNIELMTPSDHAKYHNEVSN